MTARTGLIKTIGPPPYSCAPEKHAMPVKATRNINMKNNL
jgi:hypothetical protein